MGIENVIIRKKVVPLRSMFKKTSIYALIGLSCAFLMAGCGNTVSKVLKSTDNNYKLQEAYKMYDKGSYVDAQMVLDDVAPYFRGTTEGENIAWKYCNLYYELKEYIAASYAFKQFASTYANSPKAEDALFMVARCYTKLSPNPRLEQTNTVKAIEAYELFVNTYPNSVKVEECNREIDAMRVKLYQKAYMQAELYYKIRDFRSATHDFKNLLKNYPEAENAEQARYMIVLSNYELARNSVETKQLERYQETVAAYLDLVDRHPNGKFTKQAEKIFEQANAKIQALKV